MTVRVLLVSPVGEPGGAEQVLLSLIKRLPAQNVTPVLACLQPGPLAQRAQALGASVHVFREHRMRDVHRVAQAIGWLAGLIRQERIDLVHSNFTAHLYGSIAARLTHTRELWHIHDYPYVTDRLARLQERLPNDFLLFTTPRVQSGYAHLLARPHQVVSPVSTEPETLRAYKPQPDIRVHYGIGAGPLFLTVARLQEHKGHRYLLEAVPDVLKHYADARFVFVGKAANGTQERYRDELLARCAALGIAPHVTLTGYVPDADLVALYHEAAALVHPATSEGFGLTLPDALALGVPIIAAEADGPRELLRDGETGLLVRTQNAPALAQAMLLLLNTPRLAQSLRAKGLEFAAQFNAEQMAAQTAEAYRRALS